MTQPAPPAGPVARLASAFAVAGGVVLLGVAFMVGASVLLRWLFGRPITGDVEITLTELFAYPDSITESTTEADEVGHVVDQNVDLEQPIIDAVGLALPFTPLCTPDCPGLCPECGVALAGAESDHGHDLIDPRWAKLAGMVTPDDGTGEQGS